MKHRIPFRCQNCGNATLERRHITEPQDAAEKVEQFCDACTQPWARTIMEGRSNAPTLRYTNQDGSDTHRHPDAIKADILNAVEQACETAVKHRVKHKPGK